MQFAMCLAVLIESLRQSQFALKPALKATSGESADVY